VKNWDVYERVLEKGLDHMLSDAASAHPVLLADSVESSDADRTKAAEIMFEKFGIPAYFVGTDAVLSIYSAGRTSSLFVDCGYDSTRAMLIHEGFIYPSTLQSNTVGGVDVTSYLHELLVDRKALPLGPEAQTHVNSIKERFGRIALDYASESFARRAAPEVFTLPDGSTITLENETLRSAEALFQPCLYGRHGNGISEMVMELISYCDMNDREDGPVRALTNFLLVTGGGSFIPGAFGSTFSFLTTHSS
jgi:actin-related protein